MLNLQNVQKKTWGNLCNLGLGKDFLDTMSKIHKITGTASILKTSVLKHHLVNEKISHRSGEDFCKA